MKAKDTLRLPSATGVELDERLRGGSVQLPMLLTLLDKFAHGESARTRRVAVATSGGPAVPPKSPRVEPVPPNYSPRTKWP